MTAAACIVAALGGCSPAFNWRDARFENAGLTALLPCKPDRGSKPVVMAGRPVTLSMMGCEAGGAMFAVAMVDAGDAGKVTEVLANWQAATLANIRAAPATNAVPLKLAGASTAPAPSLVTARGQSANGKVVMSQAAYFVQGSQVFQAVVYAEKVNPEASDAFFSGLRLQ
ncbi:MAG: hypothetical protein EOO28_26075 [Comamonadaceae bacterium]|nr:MAG: hypothetical protein EOO28_26075 [Comamonadaceae bacterium]